MSKKLESNLGLFTNHSHKMDSGDHLVHIYEDQKTLVENVCDFIVPALTTSLQGVVIIASSENITAFENLLERRSIDVARAKFLGQLVLLDAQTTLDSLLTHGEVDPVKFISVIGSVLTGMNQSYSKVRAYGEMVSLLWNTGRRESALKLEVMWTELSNIHNFSLLCGYYSDSRHSDLNENCFARVCTSHTHVITNDGFLKITKK